VGRERRTRPLDTAAKARTRLGRQSDGAQAGERRAAHRGGPLARASSRRRGRSCGGLQQNAAELNQPRSVVADPRRSSADHLREV